MIQFSKTVIEGVSFDKFLFNKELRKLIVWFGNDEKQKAIFQQWCIQKFGNKYNEIIFDAFKKNKVEKENIYELALNNL